MDIKVKISLKDEFDSYLEGTSNLENYDNDIVIEGGATQIELVTERVFYVMLSLGFSENQIKEAFSNYCESHG